MLKNQQKEKKSEFGILTFKNLTSELTTYKESYHYLNDNKNPSIKDLALWDYHVIKSFVK